MNCGNINDFLKLWISGEQPECYAYSGEIDENFGELTQYCTGNNVVSFTWVEKLPILVSNIAVQKWQCRTGINMYLTQIIIH
jgi:hypothetical protein